MDSVVVQTRSAQMTEAHPSLLSSASPDLYFINAFRITGLFVDASPREVARQGEKLKLMEKLGTGQAKGADILPLDAEWDGHGLREAIQRLHDPERRLVDEFFWFWPHVLGQSKDDEALKALSTGDVSLASRIWGEYENSSSESNVSMHNLAVLSHATALDLEQLSRPLTEEEQKDRDHHWRQAFTRWRLLLDYEGFWSRLTARIRDLDDPRLTTGTARRIRNALPFALLSINASLAIQAAEKGDTEGAARQLRLMKTSGFPGSAVSEALRSAVKPIRERIKLLCSTAASEAEADPVHGDKIALHLIDNSRMPLSVLDTVLPEDDPAREATHDEVAMKVRSAQIDYSKKTDGWLLSLDLLRQAMAVAVGSATRSRIEEDIKIVGEHAEETNWWCAPGYWELSGDLVAELQKARELLDQNRFEESIAILSKLLPALGEPEAVRILERAIAYALNMKAVRVFNTAQDELGEETPVFRKVRQAIGEELDSVSRQSLIQLRFLNEVQKQPQKCDCCGHHFLHYYSQNYYTVKINDIPGFLCGSCGERHNKELETKRTGFSRTLSGAPSEK